MNGIARRHYIGHTRGAFDYSMTTTPPPVPLSTNVPDKAPGLSIASLVCGIISVLGGVIILIPTILAIVFGHVSLSQIKRNNGRAGRGLSIAGLVLGYVSLVGIPVMGLMAAMAIPAFQKVRIASQEKAMLNNARMLSSAADQYYLESGKTVAAYTDIVGPDKYVKKVFVVMGEKYPQTFQQEQPIDIVKPDGTVVRYDPKTDRLTRIR